MQKFLELKEWGGVIDVNKISMVRKRTVEDYSHRHHSYLQIIVEGVLVEIPTSYSEMETLYKRIINAIEQHKESNNNNGK